MCKGIKNVLRNKQFASRAHYGIELSCLPCMASYGLVAFHRNNMAGIVWSNVVLYGLV